MDENKQTSVRRWLGKARNDLQTARAMLDVNPSVTDVICFHAQQCAEKCLKAYLTHIDRHVERTHNLKKLLKDCAAHDPEFNQLMELAESLLDYAVITRYPDSWVEIPLAEAQTAAQNAARVMYFILAKIGINPEKECR
ncbi:MAG: HEPN domain-containing protein [bacterium]